jgi:hypothetical protein
MTQKCKIFVETQGDPTNTLVQFILLTKMDLFEHFWKDINSYLAQNRSKIITLACYLCKFFVLVYKVTLKVLKQ